MNQETNSSLVRRRALVLGGGGSLGHAWLVGIIAGLYDAGIDLRKADLIIGTSAGATVSAQMSSEIQLPELYASILTEIYQPRTITTDAERVRNSNRPATANLLEITNGIIHASKDIRDMRKKMGAWALGTELGGRSRTPVEWGTHPITQAHEPTANGSCVEIIFPDKTTLDAFGNNMMDISRRPHSAEAGYKQGRAHAEQLTKIWC